MPDQNPLYQDLPRPESFEYFRNCLQIHDHVESFFEPSPQVFHVQRMQGDRLTLYLTNIYCVSTASVFDISSRVPELNCIVTISAWNGYTANAKLQATTQQIGLFQRDQVMGALRLRGGQFLDYCGPKKP